jgi:hypothetical protein
MTCLYGKQSAPHYSPLAIQSNNVTNIPNTLDTLFTRGSSNNSWTFYSPPLPPYHSHQRKLNVYSCLLLPPNLLGPYFLQRLYVIVNTSVPSFDPVSVSGHSSFPLISCCSISPRMEGQGKLGAFLFLSTSLHLTSSHTHTPLPSPKPHF